MRIYISYRHVELPRQLLEKAVDRYLVKMRKLLKSYAPDLVQVHGAFDRNPHRAEYDFSLSLSLPTCTLHAVGSGPDPKTSAHKGFIELETQIKKHQSRLRKDYEWKRKRGRMEKALA